jgi:hypothetical protein
VRKETKGAADASLERRLVELAWTDPAFAERLGRDPRGALESIGVAVPAGVRIDVRQQRRDTLYLLIPPPATKPEEADEVIEQMDLWQSGDLFCWIMPQAHKLDLLAMRESFRRANS